MFVGPFTTHFTLKGKRLLEIDNAAPAFCKDHVDGIMPQHRPAGKATPTQKEHWGSVCEELRNFPQGGNAWIW